MNGRVVTLEIREDDARHYTDWTACEAFRFEPIDDGTFCLRVKGVEPAEQGRECDWCQGRGDFMQPGPAGQYATVPCSNCGGTGRVDA